ncbi:MAG: SEL1-like repeat protein, partial [Thermoguttaceae bacterium]|nr:SEL1-like repeat protein [Thermoguttaceae bacterium]
MCRAGDCYKDGIGVGKDAKQAFEWYRKAADAGFSEATYRLGKCYEKGIGVEKNVAEAKIGYRKAAEQERYLLWKTEAEEALRRLESEAEAGVAKPTLFDASPLFAASDSASGACEPEPAAGARKTFCVRDVEFAFRYCPSGTFLMGSPASEKGRKEDETQHKVTLTRGFWTLETPVTQRMYEAITGRNPSWFSLNGGGWEKILELDDRDTSEFPVERVGMRACQ